jgi:hypothetical protein
MTRVPRNALTVLLLLYTLLAFHIALWPYNFRFDRGFTAKRVSEISWLPEIKEGNRGTIVRDVVLNLWFFIPFGALVYLKAIPANGGQATGRGLFISLGAGLLVSTAIETAQVWLPRRFPSTADILANSAGALIGGCLAAGILHVRALAGPERARSAFRRNLPFLALAAYCLALLAAAVHSMDPVVSYTEFAARAKAFLWGASRVPFNLVLAAGPFLAAAVLALLFASWSAGAFPFLLPGRVFFLTVAVCAVYVLGLESLLVLFRSRIPSRVDAMASVLGVAYGALMHHLVPGARKGNSVPLALAHYVLLALYVFLVPFDFAASHFHLEWRDFLPFHYIALWSDYSTPFFLLRPVAAHLPLGFACARWREASGQHLSPTRAAAWAALAQTLVETGRAFSSTRHPGATNILLAGLAAHAGAHLFRATLSWGKNEGAASPPETAPATSCRAQDGPSHPA